MKTCGCKAHDDMMKCNKQIKHMAATKNMEGVWSIGLGLSQVPPDRLFAL